MPTYRVKARCFIDGKLYDPEGKRPFYNRDKPFTKKNPCPKHLEPLSEAEQETIDKAKEAAFVDEVEKSNESEQTKDDTSGEDENSEAQNIAEVLKGDGGKQGAPDFSGTEAKVETGNKVDL